MENAEKMALIQATVTYKVDLCTLVPAELAANETKLKELCEDLAAAQFKHTGEDDIDIDNEVPVVVSKETRQKYEKQCVSKTAWKEIITEHRQKGSQTDETSDR